MGNPFFALPRLYVESDLLSGKSVSLSDQQIHYLKNVMRKQEGDCIRLFNTRHGEWLAEIITLRKKQIDVKLDKQIIEQPVDDKEVHLIFAPLKKNRMDILIEKAVELGATDLHPIITQRSDVRKIKDARLESQILEAAEQCERFMIPRLHKLQSLEEKLQGWSEGQTLFACFERGEDQSIEEIEIPSGSGFVVGPPGGFEEHETELLSRYDFIQPVSLGERIYRAETASIVCLVYAGMANKKNS